ncbi:MAG TPA: hypothetical protein VHM48_11455 [Candidatus Limnocylindrales bacterium]|nr:hypothetical protein [Candidatus Limnocylindrales bacterium]
MTAPIDETQPHASPDPAAPVAPSAAPVPSPAPSPAAAAPPSPDSRPALRADPDRPADSGWREPAWFPPRADRERHRDRRSGTFTIVVGLVLIAIGAWYFLDGTLGIALPRIRWGSLWPVVLIVIGGLILLRSFRRKA